MFSAHARCRRRSVLLICSFGTLTWTCGEVDLVMMALDNECTAAAPQLTRTEGTWSFTAPRFPSFSLIRSTCFLIVIRYLPDIGIVNLFICLFVLHFSWASACLIFVCHHLMIRASYRDVLLQNHFCLSRFSGTSLALFLWLFSYLNELFARYWNCKLINLFIRFLMSQCMFDCFLSLMIRASCRDVLQQHHFFLSVWLLFHTC